MTNNVLLGIGGGTGSGKTVLSNNLLNKFNRNEIAIIRQDSYYRDLSHKTSQERARTNFDHPEAINFDLLAKHLGILLNGESVEMPVYDYSTHTRASGKKRLYPHPISMEDVIEQYMNPVRPMHEEFVEITKKYADIILPKGGDNSVAVDLIQTKIQTLLKAKMPNN